MPDLTFNDVPAVDAIANIRSKIGVPTERWNQHLELPRSKAFVVAGATKMDVVNDLQESLAKALENGTTITDFRRDFDKTVEANGWGYKGQRGWRTQVIYNNNLRSAQMAGRWAQIQRVKKRRPYLIYVTVGDTRVRPLHRAWNGLVLHVDDPWWDTHYPPNGWGCRCSVTSANDAALKRRNLKVSSKAPDIVETDRINSNTGEVYGPVPQGIDVGWNHNPGKAWLAPDAVFGEKLMALPPPVRKAVLANNGPAQEALSQTFSTWSRKVLSSPSRGELQTVGWLKNDTIEALEGKDISVQTAAISISDSRLKRMQRDLKTSKGKDLPKDVLFDLPEQLRQASAVLIDSRGGLAFVLKSKPLNKAAKVVVYLNFRDRGELTNSVRSGSLTTLRDLKNKGFYEVLIGEL